MCVENVVVLKQKKSETKFEIFRESGMKKSMCLRMCLYEKIIHDAKPNMNSKYKTTCCVPTKNSSGLTYTTSKFNIRNPNLN